MGFFFNPHLNPLLIKNLKGLDLFCTNCWKVTLCVFYVYNFVMKISLDSILFNLIMCVRFHISLDCG